MLSGTPPFYEEEPFKLFEQIKNCQYEFDDETWSSVSAEAKDFIKKILVADPKARLSCKQMLDHPWMKKDLNTDKKLNKAKLMRYVSMRKEKSKKKVAADDDDDM